MIISPTGLAILHELLDVLVSVFRQPCNRLLTVLCEALIVVLLRDQS